MQREDFQESWENIVEIGFSDYNKLNNAQKIWFNIEPLTTDGILDHYINYGAEHNEDTINGLEVLGFHDIADLLRNVNSLFVNSIVPIDIDERGEILGNNENDSFLDEIDEAYWKRNDALEKALLNHIIQTGIGK
jgi:hypothetical protein